MLAAAATGCRASAECVVTVGPSRSQTAAPPQWSALLGFIVASMGGLPILAYLFATVSILVRRRWSQLVGWVSHSTAAGGLLTGLSVWDPDRHADHEVIRALFLVRRVSASAAGSLLPRGHCCDPLDRPRSLSVCQATDLWAHPAGCHHFSAGELRMRERRKDAPNGIGNFRAQHVPFSQKTRK